MANTAQLLIFMIFQWWEISGSDGRRFRTLGHCVFCVVCCVLLAARYVLRAARNALRAMCSALRSAYCVLCVVCCGLCIVHCVLRADVHDGLGFPQKVSLASLGFLGVFGFPCCLGFLLSLCGVFLWGFSVGFPLKVSPWQGLFVGSFSGASPFASPLKFPPWKVFLRGLSLGLLLWRSP